MFTERLQVRLSRAQLHRLEAEAQRRGASVSAIVREAVDARFHSVRLETAPRGVPLETRLRAIAQIKAMRGGRFLTIGKLERIVDEERERPFKS